MASISRRGRAHRSNNRHRDDRKRDHGKTPAPQRCRENRRDPCPPFARVMSHGLPPKAAEEDRDSY